MNMSTTNAGQFYTSAALFPGAGNPIQSTSVQPAPVPPPTMPAVDERVAQDSIRRLVSFQLRSAGFRKAEDVAVKRIEAEVIAYVERLYRLAHEYANLANRASPIVTDAINACDQFGLKTTDLRRVKARSDLKRKRRPIDPVEFIPPESRSPSPELLESEDENDDEGGGEMHEGEGRPETMLPATLQGIPTRLPALPPKHTYQRTPVMPPKKAALPSLEKKLKTASLVQQSLRNLLLATEDSENQEDGELLGHIVNWEAGVNRRKRWKLA